MESTIDDITPNNEATFKQVCALLSRPSEFMIVGKYKRAEGEVSVTCININDAMRFGEMLITAYTTANYEQRQQLEAFVKTASRIFRVTEETINEIKPII